MLVQGEWRAAVADDDLRRAFSDPGFDDGSWEAVSIPHHWRSMPAFEGTDGPLLYRTSLRGVAPSGPRQRVWLTFEGVFYQADVWLDGRYLGDTEGYFVPHAFDITEAVSTGAETGGDHVLAVEVACNRPGDLTAKRNLTGVFQHWDCADPDGNPGGIWRPVTVTETGPVRIARLSFACLEASAERAVVELDATFDAADAVIVQLVTRVAGTHVVSEQPLAKGENRRTWRVTVEQPSLWWPHALGEPNLVLATVEVACGAEGAEGVSDRWQRRVGLRQVRMNGWVASVNGERLFLKGINQGPTRLALAEATGAELEDDVQRAVAANLDLLRVHGHISRPELYDAADRAGLLLWQDMPLQWGYARGVRAQATRQARAAVDLLGHHPSILLWCGHNEPLGHDLPPGGGDDKARRRAAIRFGLGQQLPTWNKTVLDNSIKRALEKADRSRPVLAHSGVLPHVGSVGTDTHLYFGWYHGEERDLPTALAAVPRLAGFLSEFGAQAVPETDDFIDASRWPDLDWEHLARRHALQRFAFDRYVPPQAFASYPQWKAATQAYQADVIRFHIETLRRLKYRPAGGFCAFSLADGLPLVSWAVLDHERVPKLGYDALVAACAPVIVVADRPAAAYAVGDRIELDVHVVSDRRDELAGARVSARLQTPDGELSWTWTGDIPADGCVRVGRVESGQLTSRGVVELDLDLEHPSVKATSRYESEVLPR